MDEWTDKFPLLVAVAILVPAVVKDMREHRIPNLLCLTGFLAGLMLHGASSGPLGALMACGSAALLLGITLPLYAIRWFGAGDVKLIAAMGAIAGVPSLALAMLAATAIAGGFLAIGMHWHWQRRLPGGIRVPSASASGATEAAIAAQDATTPNALPFAIAIALGSTGVLLAQILGAG